MNSNKIIPSLWFTADGGNIAGVVEYYKTIFGSDFEEGTVIPLGETPTGYAEMTEVKIFGKKYSFMCTAEVHQLFNDSVSLTINCKDQEEIDKYWNYFTFEGHESMCAWCIDKYGLRWQIIPENLAELMQLPGSFEVMMQQQKIIIADYFKN